MMNYPLKDAIIHFITHNDTLMLRQTLAMLRDNYPKIVLDSLMNILGTHDTVRILTAFGGIPAKNKDEMNVLKMDHPEIRKKAIECVKIAALLLFTLPGNPCIYYGDEIGMEGYSDPFCRCPFQWDRIDSDLLSYFQKLAEIRYSYHVFKDSEYKELFADTNCLIYERRLLNEVVVVCVNRGYNKFDLKFKGQFYDLFNGKLYLNQYCVLPKSCSILSNKHLI